MCAERQKAVNPRSGLRIRAHWPAWLTASVIAALAFFWLGTLFWIVVRPVVIPPAQIELPAWRGVEKGPSEEDRQRIRDIAEHLRQAIRSQIESQRKKLSGSAQIARAMPLSRVKITTAFRMLSDGRVVVEIVAWRGRLGRYRREQAWVRHFPTLAATARKMDLLAAEVASAIFSDQVAKR